jgi:hypothetical protein
MRDSDLAELYEVPTFRLNEAVKRNRGRFPKDFMFQLTKEEAQSLTSQIAISKKGRGECPVSKVHVTNITIAQLTPVKLTSNGMKSVP